MVEKISKIIDEIIEYILVLVLIIGTRSVYIHQPIIDIQYNVVISKILVGVLLICIMKFIVFEYDFKTLINKVKTFVTKYLKYFVLYYILMYLFFRIHNIIDEEYFNLFYITVPMFIIILIARHEKIYDISKKIVNVMLIISIISLVCYFTISIFNIIKTNMEIVLDWGGVHPVNSFYHIYFECQQCHFFGQNIIRNTGIFTEGPMYNLLLSIALVLETFILKRQNRVIKFILVLTILTTFSITGIIMLAVIYSIQVFEFIKNNKNIDKKLKIGMIFLILLFFVVSIICLKDKLNTSSGITRIDDYKASFRAWLESPIVGIGLRNEKEIVKYMGAFRIDNPGLSNSFMVLLAEGGLMLFIIYFIPFVVIAVYSIKNKKYNILYFEISILTLFISTIFHYTPIMMWILSLGYTVILKNEKISYEDIKKN